MFGFNQQLAKTDTNTSYEMLLVYVDDVLAISHEPKVLIDTIGEYYKVKPGSYKEPDIYLGANVKKVQMPDGREVLGYISSRLRQECYQDCRSKVYLRRTEKGMY
jgi:hypothetical protein